MKTESRVIQECIRKLAGVTGLKQTGFFVGEVTAVNEDDRLCTVVSTLDEESITYDDVNLSPERNDGMILIPALESSVICARMADGNVYVLNCSDVEKVLCYIDSSNYFEFSSSGFIWNGGAFGGMTKTLVLKAELDKVNAQLQAVIAALTTWTPAAGDGGAALKVATATALVGKPAGVFTGIEDTKIKH